MINFRSVFMNIMHVVIGSVKEKMRVMTSE